MMDKDLYRKAFPILLAIGIFISLMAQATIVGPGGVSDATWSNATYGNFNNLILGETDYTTQIQSISNISSGNISYPDTVTCIIDGSYYTAYLSNGTILYNNTSAYTCLQTALNYVTSDASGTPVWNSSLRVLVDTSILVGAGTWDIGANELAIPSRVIFKGMGREATTIEGSHANNVIEAMWSNVTWGAAIYDMRIDGESSAIPIRWDLTAASLPSGETYGWGLLDLQRLHLTDYDTYSFYWNTDSGDNAVLHIDDVRAQGIWMLDRIFDSTISTFQCSKLIIKDSSASIITHFYIGGGHDYNIRIYDGSLVNDNYDLTFSYGICDNPLETCVIVEDYAENIIFDTITFSNLNWGAANDTYSAVILEGTTNHIQIKNSQFTNDLNYRRDDAGTDRPAATWKYVIEEQSGSANNTFTGNSYADHSRWPDALLFDRVGGRLYKTWDPTVSNFENRKITYSGGISSDYGDVVARVGQPFGLYSSSTGTYDNRALIWWTSGYFANLKARIRNAAGAGEWRDMDLEFDGAGTGFGVNITDANTYGTNSSFTEITGDANGVWVSWMFTSSAGSATNLRHYWEFDFYPRAEEWLGIP